MRVGLFGGTFNPIHLGHLSVAQLVLERLKLDQILFIPTGTPPHKQSIDFPSGRDRFKMVRLALKNHPQFAVSNMEVNRVGISYTVDTVRALKQRHPQKHFFFIIGTDAFSGLSQWKDPETLLRLCPFVVVPRMGCLFSSLPIVSLLDKINKTALIDLDRQSRQRYTFSTSKIKVCFLRVATPSIAASAIRANPTQNGGLLPEAVFSYIMKEQFYDKAGSSQKNCR
jgi:nicotinate-nucleotide adenylyltransferase